MKKNYSSIFYSVRILLLILFPSLLMGQQHKLWQGKEGYNWVFGDHVGLNFANGNPFPFQGVPLKSMEGSTSISNPSGELLFYAGDGMIWNRNHEVMENGTALFGDVSSTQYGVIVPKPGNPNIYYYFSIDFFNGLAYSEVDMSLDGGYGGVTGTKNVILNSNAKTEKITSAYHSNGKDIWVVTHVLGSNEYVAYLVTENGISNTPVISAVGVDYPAYDPVDDNSMEIYDYIAGQLKISPDGTKIASAMCGAFLGDHKGIDLFDFNNTTGEISNPVFLDGFDGSMYGVEFSPNSRYLYTADPVFMIFLLGNGRLYQYDIQAGDETAIKNTKTILADLSGTASHFGGFQLAPDGKIYICNSLNPNSHVINYPNNAGTAAGYAGNAVGMGQGVNQLSLSTFIQTYFESGILHEGECSNQDVTFSTLRIPGITSVKWNFGDPNSGTANISNEPVHSFSGAGTYTVTAEITSNGAVQIVTTEVVIIAGPDAVLPDAQGLGVCDNGTGTAIFNLSEFDGTILAGQNTAIFSVDYFKTKEDAKTNSNIIVDKNEFLTSGQTIYAVVTNSETGCRTIIHFDLVINPLPVVNTPQQMEQCSSVFNLRTQDITILNGQNPDIFKVIYYTDANGNTVIAQPESFSSTGQIVYASVINIVTNCSAMTSFDLVITPATILPGNLIVEGCSPFDLTLIAEQLEPGLTFSFYRTEEDASKETNVIADPKKYILPDANTTVYIIAETAEGCTKKGELKLQAAGCIIPKGISPNGDGMNDTFDLSAFDVKHLEIFNRYGQEVFSHSHYTNQWQGQANNGNELPTGTYYYAIERSSGERTTGWVYINRNSN